MTETDGKYAAINPKSWLLFAGYAGAGDLDTDAGEGSDLLGQGGNNALRGILCDGDDADIPGAVGQPHTADDVFSVIMEQGVQLVRCFGVLNDDAHNSNCIFHMLPLENAASVKMRQNKYNH